MSASDRYQYAREQARDLLKVARKLNEPGAKHLMLQQAVNAQVLANRIVWALQLEDDPASATIDEELGPGLQAPMQALADVIRDTIHPHGFALLVFDFGGGGRMNYVSNARRDDICIAMREFIAACEDRLMPEPERPQ